MIHLRAEVWILRWLASQFKLARELFATTPLGENLYRDVCVALRRGRASLATTLTSIAILSLSIGVVATVYTIIHSVAFPLQVPNDDRIVNIKHSDSGTSGSLLSLSWPDFQDLRREQRAFSHVAAWSRVLTTLIGPRGSSRFRGEAVTGAYFQISGIAPHFGRLITDADDSQDAMPVVVLGYQFWNEHFDADKGVIGRVVSISGLSFTVIGVTPPTYRGSSRSGMEVSSGWISVSARSFLEPEWAKRLADRDARIVRVHGLLEHEGSIEAAAIDIRAVAQRLDKSHPIGTDLPEEYRRSLSPQTSRLWTVVSASDVLIDESVNGMARPAIAILMGLLIVVLLITNSNLASLALAKAERQVGDLAIRISLGASGRRLVQEQLVATTLLAACGVGGGLLLSQGFLRFLSGMVQVSSEFIVHIQPEVGVATLVVATLAASWSLFALGLLPVLASLRDLAPGGRIRTIGLTVTPRSPRRRLLMGVQGLVSCVLLGIAALGASAIWQISHRSTGIDLERIAFVEADPGRRGDVAARLNLAIDAVEARWGNRTEFAAATALPFGLLGPTGAVASVETSARTWPRVVAATPRVFDVLGVPLLAGRSFAATKDSGRAEVVLSVATARRLFQEADALGQVVMWRQTSTDDVRLDGGHAAVVVGIAADTDTSVGERKGAGTLYVPFDHREPYRQIVFLARGEHPGRLASDLRRVVEEGAPELAIAAFAPATSLLTSGTLLLRLVSSLATVLGLFAFALVATGLYATMAHAVTARMREFGIRVALGADRSHIINLMVRQGLAPVIVGLVAGILVSVSLRLATGEVAGRIWSITDGLAAVGVLTLLASAVFVACYLPARRAAMVDPCLTLKSE